MMKAGVLDYERNALGPIVSARCDVVGEAADGPPKFLVRVDEFPHYLAFDEPSATIRPPRSASNTSDISVPPMISWTMG